MSGHPPQRRQANVSSILLTPQENEFLFNHLGRKCIVSFFLFFFSHQIVCDNLLAWKKQANAAKLLRVSCRETGDKASHSVCPNGVFVP